MGNGPCQQPDMAAWAQNPSRGEHILASSEQKGGFDSQASHGVSITSIYPKEGSRWPVGRSTALGSLHGGVKSQPGRGARSRTEPRSPRALAGWTPPEIRRTLSSVSWRHNEETDPRGPRCKRRLTCEMLSCSMSAEDFTSALFCPISPFVPWTEPERPRGSPSPHRGVPPPSRDRGQQQLRGK